ncbi:alpha/beta fold hydrolase [Arthrobacter cavernae]|uniref:Alpha/beta hydrolase n=1 Tax=Arthrobacter cavernae TaxID=2817681 RepID=A0A939HER9_9MICC|nr:alpha/beta hydrolase [Arthrobacter cavernae]MBO1269582.1 alpha/beta hydrolase [Arthrobacter cavernae]
MDSTVRELRLRTGITVPCFVDGRLVHGRAAGLPLLLLHPWGESRHCFDRLIPLLREGSDALAIIAPDLRGQGEAAKPADGYSLEEQAEDVAALLEALGIPEAYVLGSSSGGYVAQQLAVTHPETVAALVLVGSPLSLKGRPAFADDVEQLTDPVDPDWVRESLSWFRLLHTVPAWYIEDRIRDGTAMPAHAWKAILHGLCEAVPPTEAGTIDVPTLILWGAHDSLLPRRHQEALAARIRSSRLKMYESTGHLVLWEVPERVAEDTAAFLAAQPDAWAVSKRRRPG